MSKDNLRKRDLPIIHSSAAEYLTFVAATGDQSDAIEVRYQDENIWLTQKMMASLYGVTVAAINQHIKRIFADGELDESAVIKDYLITASDGKNYQAMHYCLQAITAVGFKIENERANSEEEHMGLTSWEAAPRGKHASSWLICTEEYRKASLFRTF